MNTGSNFTISGYPLTFLTMLTVSLIVSTLTSQIKRQEQLRVETDRETMRANLLRAISHDLRTPLTSIVGSASAVLENDERLDAARFTVRDDGAGIAPELLPDIFSPALASKIYGSDGRRNMGIGLSGRDPAGPGPGHRLRQSPGPGGWRKRPSDPERI